jgi:hypothetical protein
MGALHQLKMAQNRSNERDQASTPPAHPSSLPPSSTERPSGPASRRDRMRDRTRSATLKIRPWSQLPGVVAYTVFDGENQLTDCCGEPTEELAERASAFREKVRGGRFDGSHLLEVGVGTTRLLSVARPDGWFVHIWIEGATDVAGILSVVGGK